MEQYYQGITNAPELHCVAAQQSIIYIKQKEQRFSCLFLFFLFLFPFSCFVYFSFFFAFCLLFSSLFFFFSSFSEFLANPYFPKKLLMKFTKMIIFPKMFVLSIFCSCFRILSGSFRKFPCFQEMFAFFKFFHIIKMLLFYKICKHYNGAYAR